MKSIRNIILPIACMICSPAFAYTFTATNADGVNLYYNATSNSTAEVTYQTKLVPTDSYAGKVVIPSTVENDGVKYTVTGIGDRAFYGCRYVSSIEIPGSIAQVGRWAFACCDGLTEISLPSSLSQISADAFDGCYALTDINVQSGNSNYMSRDGILYSTDGQTLIAYPAGREGQCTVNPSVTKIADGAFGGCTFIDRMELPAGLTTIGDNALYFCGSISSLTIPASVQHIGNSAFADCISLRYIDVEPGNSCYSTYKGHLYDINGTKLIQSPSSSADTYITNKTETIGQMACYRNIAMTTAILPSSLTTIEQAAFVDCINLTSVNIPASVKSIGDMAFGLDNNIENMVVNIANPADVKLGDGVFEGMDFDKCTLHVPAGSAEMYSKAHQWSQFTNISENDGLLEQSIEWDSDNDVVIDGKYIRMSATATSGLPVRYIITPNSEGIGVVSNNSIEVIVPGKLQVTAYQPGDEKYMAAHPVIHNFFDPGEGIEDVINDTNNIRVYGRQGMISVRGTDEVADVYTTSGVRVYSGTARDITVAPNLYIVRIGQHGYKVIVK